MARVSIVSFEALSLEFSSQHNGSGSMSLRKECRLDIDTTDSIITGMMACSSPNPEEALLEEEERLGSMWDEDMSITNTRDAFIAAMLKKV